jgi:hypothetical protein
VVIDGLEESPPGTLSRRAERVALILEDPVRLIAGRAGAPREGAGRPTEQASADYVRAMRRLTRPGAEPPLVIAADELRAPGSGVATLLRHLRVSEGVDGETLATVSIEPLPSLGQGRRSLLFARVRDDVERLEQLSGRTFRSWRFSAPVAAGSSPARPAAGLFYAGRHRAAVAPPGVIRLDEWDVLPVKLGPRLDAASSLTVLDPMSFPFDSLRDSDRDIPLAVQLPGGWSSEQVVVLLGKPLLEYLGPFDLVAVDDDRVFASLRNRYSWPANARASPAQLPGFATRIALDRLAPVRRHKADDRVLRAAARAEVVRALEAVAPGEQPRGIVVGRPIQQWATLLPLGATGLIGVDFDRANLSAAAASFPEWRFVDEIPDEIEVVHLALTMMSLTSEERDERLRRLRTLFATLRVGGRMVIIERFLDAAGGHALGAPGPKQLLSEVGHASAGHLVLAQVQTLRLTGEDLFGIGLFAFAKVGRPERE